MRPLWSLLASVCRVALHAALLFVAAPSLQPAFCQQPTSSLDRDPGWAIVLAVDYQGKRGTIYGAVQADAIAVCQTLVSAFGLRPDRIILLAEGDSIRRFQDIGYSHAGPPSSSIEPTITKLRPEEIGQLHFSRAAGGRDDGSARPPFVVEPTAVHFRAARDIVSRLATDTQFVMVVVSAHGTPDRKDGSSRGVIPTVGYRAAADASVETRRLTLEELVPKAARARYRLVVVDACFSAQMVRRLNGRRPGRLGTRSGIYSADAQAMSDGDADSCSSSPLVVAMSAETEAQVQANEKSAFLQCLFPAPADTGSWLAQLEQIRSAKNEDGLSTMADLSLRDWLDAACKLTYQSTGPLGEPQRPLTDPPSDHPNLRASVVGHGREGLRAQGRRSLDRVASSLRAADVARLRRILDHYCDYGAATQHELQIVKLLENDSGGADLASELKRAAAAMVATVRQALPGRDRVVDATGKPVERVMLVPSSDSERSVCGPVQLVEMRNGVGNGLARSPAWRADAIRDRFTKLQKAEDPWPIDVRAENRDGNWLVWGPVPDEQLVQVDRDMAQFYPGVTPKRFAPVLADRIRMAMDPYPVAQGRAPCSDAKTSYEAGLLQAQQRRFGEAARQFVNAIDLSPNYPEAYLQLAFAHWHQGKAAEALECLRVIETEITPRFVTPQIREEMKRLRAQMRAR